MLNWLRSRDNSSTGPAPTRDSGISDSQRIVEKERVKQDPSALGSIIAGRLEGTSEPTRHKNDRPQVTKPFRPALVSLLEDFGEDALPHLMRHLEPTTILGDYANSYRYTNLDTAMSEISKAGLGPQMAELLIEKRADEWDAKIFRAIEELKEPAFVPGLTNVLLFHPSQKLSDGYRSGPGTEVVQRLLEGIAEKAGLTAPELLVLSAETLSSSLSSPYRMKEAGKEFLVNAIKELFLAEENPKHEHLKPFKAILRSGLLSADDVFQIESHAAAGSGELPSEDRKALRLSCLTHLAQNGGLEPSALTRLRKSAAQLSNTSEEAKRLGETIEKVESGIAQFPDFEGAEWTAKLLPEAYKLVLGGSDFEVTFAPEQFDRVFKKVVSTPEDPRAAIDPERSFGRQYVRYDQEKRKRSDAALAVSERSF